MNDLTQLPGYAEEEVRIEALRQKVMKLTGYTYDQANSVVLPGISLEDILDEVSKHRKLNVTSKDIPENITSIISDRLKERVLEGVAPSTGYPSLDAHIKGFIPGHLYTMTGDTNVGKTAAACNFAYRMGMQGDKKILYFALEPDRKIADYLASIASEVKYDDLKDEDYKFIPPSIEIFTKDKVPTLKDLVRIVTELDRYDLIIIDHIGYYVTDTHNTTQAQSNAMKELAFLAKSKKTAILVIAHLNKAAKDIPSANDISGSAAFKQDSTEVLILFRKYVENDQFNLEFLNDGYILVAKTKSGKSGAVPIKFLFGTDGASIVENNSNYLYMKNLTKGGSK